MDQEKINVLNCKNAKINGKNIVLKNDMAQGEVYPIFYGLRSKYRQWYVY